MEYRKLGKTDIEVSAICLGCWALIGGSTWGEQDRSDSRDAVRAAYDAGVTFFDTAEGYGQGESEALIGDVLGDVRNEVVIASKVSRGHLGPDQVRACCEESLRQLGTDRIDLYQVHWPNPDVPLAETLGAMEDLKAEGKIRAVGVSNFGPEYLADALALAEVVSNQVCYNLLFRAVEAEVQPMCARRGVSILPYSPMAQGLLTGKFHSPDEVPEGRARTRLFSKDRPESRHDEPGCEEAMFAALDRIREIAEDVGKEMNHVALAWLLSRERVVSVLAGARNAEQARDNAAAAGTELSDDTLRALCEATRPLKEYVGANIDLWQTDSRANKSET